MKCFFCGSSIPKGEGKIVVSRTGEIIPLCSSKCEKNLKLGRKPHKIKWTEKYRESHEKKEKISKKVVEKKTRKKLSKKERRELRRKKKLEKKLAKKKHKSSQEEKGGK